jgi:hypothetical protein
MSKTILGSWIESRPKRVGAMLVWFRNFSMVLKMVMLDSSPDNLVKPGGSVPINAIPDVGTILFVAFRIQHV